MIYDRPYIFKNSAFHYTGWHVNFLRTTLSRSDVTLSMSDVVTFGRQGRRRQQQWRRPLAEGF